MKILFLPYYYYIQYEPFKLIIKELLNRGIDAKMLYIPNISPKDEISIYNPDKFSQDGIPFIEFRLKRFISKNNNFRPFFQILQFIWNSRKLKKLLKTVKPDAVVIGSHLGGIYIRVVQILCYKISIPIISMWMIEVNITTNDRAIPKWLPFPPTIKDILRWKPYNNYTALNLFVVTGRILKEHLIKMGIKETQIVITGNPSHDEIYENLDKSKSILKDIGLKEVEKYIVLLTEVIHEVFGINYLKNLVRVLKNAFDKLPLDIKVVIKFHPRETEETKAIFKKELSGERYFFLENANLPYLLHNAEISIGHYTKALEISFVVGTPVLSINFSGNKDYSIYGDNKIMECNNPLEFEEKLISFFTDKSFYIKAMMTIENYIKENICAVDGNIIRAVDAILTHINNFKK